MVLSLFPYVVVGYLRELMVVKVVRLQGEVAACKKAERRRKVIEKEGKKGTRIKAGEEG